MTFERRDLGPELAAVREAHVPDTLVLDCSTDFETLDSAALDDRAGRVDALDALTYRGHGAADAVTWAEKTFGDVE